MVDAPLVATNLARSQNAYILTKSTSSLNTTQPLKFDMNDDTNVNGMHNLHLFQSRFRYSAVDILCCLRRDVPPFVMERPEAQYGTTCEDPIIRSLYLLSQPKCRAGGRNTTEFLLCLTAEVLGLFDAGSEDLTKLGKYDRYEGSRGEHMDPNLWTQGPAPNRWGNASINTQ